MSLPVGGLRMIWDTIVTAFFEPFVKRLTLAVRRHVFPSLGITVLITLMSLFLLLNPWAGSQQAKFFVMSYMVGGADDVEFILRHGVSDSNFSPTLIAGAARAGFYTTGDSAIVERWSDDFAGSDYINQRNMDKRFAAILAARRKAELHEAPFQPIGLKGIASSPSCEKTRPNFNQVYVRANSYIASQLRPGDTLRISRQDGLGRPVIASVNQVPDMPDDTDIYLNRRQFVDYLQVQGPSIAVRAVITSERPNQDEEDRYAPDVAISCKRG